MANENPGSRANISGLSMAMIFAQSLIILTLSIWLYKEYQDNQYLQTYLSGVFQGQGSMVALLGLAATLAVGFVGILLKAGNIMGEIENLSSKIDNRTEMVRGIEAPSTMPVLDVVGASPTDDISRIRGSMLRWTLRSSRLDRDN